MSSRCELARRMPAALALACAAFFALPSAAAAAPSAGEGDPCDEPPALRACADPDAMPFSDAAGEGFENELARRIAADFGVPLVTTWWPQRRGFLRNTVQAGACDVVLGVPTALDMLATTRPYYRSSYVVLSRPGSSLAGLASLDDARLRVARIGVPLVGDDGANTPPASALVARGLVDHVVGFMAQGDASRPGRLAIVEAVASGDVDVAIAWGPLAAWHAARCRPALIAQPVTPAVEVPFVLEVYDVSMGVRRDDVELRARLDDWIVRHREQTRALLLSYHVPLVEAP